MPKDRVRLVRIREGLEFLTVQFDLQSFHRVVYVMRFRGTNDRRSHSRLL